MWKLYYTWLNYLLTQSGRPRHKQPWMERRADEFPHVVFVTPALYCKTEMILFPWQLCVNVLCAVFLHFMPSACSVYHCLLSDWGYCTVSLLLVLVEGGPSWDNVEPWCYCTGLQASAQWFGKDTWWQRWFYVWANQNIQYVLGR